MKKKILSGVALAGCLVGLAACGSGDATKKVELLANMNDVQINSAEVYKAKDAKGLLELIKDITPTKEGYKFTGWYINKGCTTAFDENTDFSKLVDLDGNGALNLYAKMEVDVMYTVSFDAGTIKIDSVLVSEGNKVDAPEFNLPNGFEFKGWYRDSRKKEAYDFNSEVTKDMTLYAKFSYNPTELDKVALSDKGYAEVNNTFEDFSKYENTSAYRKVSNATELAQALKDARMEYTNTITSMETFDNIDKNYIVRENVRKVGGGNWLPALTKGLYLKDADGNYNKIPVDTPWDENDPVYTKDLTYYEDSTLRKVEYTQTVTKEATVHVIEITDDIDLGYKKLSQEAISTGVYSNWTKTTSESEYTMTDLFKEYGISKVSVSKSRDLLIYSKNGARLTHGGFAVESCDNVAFRNLEMDEIWQWEDASKASTRAVGDMDAFGWAYFKIGFSGHIWIDHCTFGKSYDGQIDVSNPTYNTGGTLYRAPYGTNNENGVHISYCDFKAGSDNKDGYLYKMMMQIEESYQKGEKNYLYYNTLRNNGFSFDDILYGVAIPQKKAFLLGDSGDDVYYNQNLRVSIANCNFVNIEDRIPKVRTGVAYMYNCVVDNSAYYQRRADLRARNAAAFVKDVNSTWKLALVSQAILPGNMGSIAAKNCVFKGVEYLLKANDDSIKNQTEIPGISVRGGYKIDNISYQKGANDAVITDPALIPTEGLMSTSYFTWRTENGEAPFTVQTVALDQMANNNLHMGIGCGVKEGLNIWL